jgi:hypothetical protein
VSAVFLQLAAASDSYIHYALKTRENSGGGGRRNCTEAGSVQWFTFSSRLDLSVGQWVI